MLNGATLRIRAEREVTRGRAAILKAYYLKNLARSSNPDSQKEVLTVALNEETGNVPYTLGTAFLRAGSHPERGAIPASTPPSRTSISTPLRPPPAVIFPILINLAQKHLKKLLGQQYRAWQYFMTSSSRELLRPHGRRHYPTRMNLPQQGSFQLGYYHQTQARYQKKEENKHV